MKISGILLLLCFSLTNFTSTGFQQMSGREYVYETFKSFVNVAHVHREGPVVKNQTPQQNAGWQQLAPGMELKYFKAKKPSAVGDSRFTVLRIDPKSWDIVFAGISLSGETSGRTAREWCKAQNLGAATNAGMFETDYKTHTGYLQYKTHINSERVNEYQSVAAFGPRRPGLPPFKIFDLDAPGVTMKSILEDYDSAVQNLRLIKRPGLNRWPSSNRRKWSEAALGEDAAGRILFIFTRSPFSMHDFNRELLSAGIELVAAQHLEGGPEAQLFVKTGDFTLEQFGSHETGFREDDGNKTAWPVPNVLGLRQKTAK